VSGLTMASGGGTGEGSTKVVFDKNLKRRGRQGECQLGIEIGRKKRAQEA